MMQVFMALLTRNYILSTVHIFLKKNYCKLAKLIGVIMYKGNTKRIYSHTRIFLYNIMYDTKKL